jgi:hypothetical protein
VELTASAGLGFGAAAALSVIWRVPASAVVAIARPLLVIALVRPLQALALVRVIPSVTVSRSPFTLHAEKGYVGPVRLAMTDVPAYPTATATLIFNEITKTATLTPPATFSFDIAAGDLAVPGSYRIGIEVHDGTLVNPRTGTLVIEGKTQ